MLTWRAAFKSAMLRKPQTKLSNSAGTVDMLIWICIVPRVVPERWVRPAFGPIKILSCFCVSEFLELQTAEICLGKYDLGGSRQSFR